MFKLSKSVKILYLTLLMFIIGLLALSFTDQNTNQSKLSNYNICKPQVVMASEDQPPTATTLEDWYECMKNALEAYMNQLIEGLTAAGLAPGSGGPVVGSPVFNTSNTPDFDGFTNGGSFGGANNPIMINAYNVAGGKTVCDYVKETNAKFPGRKIIITETGWHDYFTGAVGKEEAKEKLRAAFDCVFSSGANIGAIMFFNGAGTGGSEWDKFKMTPEEMNYVIGTHRNDTKWGINTASYANMNPGGYASVNDLIKNSPPNGYGLDAVLNIFSNSDLDKMAAALNDAISKGLMPIIRIGVGMDSGGFDTPQEYVNFLKAMAARGVDLSALTIIGGPNEPDLEGWLAMSSFLGDPCGIPPEKLMQYQGQGKCGAKYGMEPLIMDNTTAGFWKVRKTASQSVTVGKNSTPSLGDLDDQQLQALFQFSATGTHDHEKVFTAITDFFLGTDSVNEDILDLNVPVMARTMPPGIDQEPMFEQGIRKYNVGWIQTPEIALWDIKSLLDKWVKKSDSTIENISLIGCIQEINTASETPPIGRVFPTSGTIDLDEPADIEGASKVLHRVSRQLAGLPTNDELNRYSDSDSDSESSDETAFNFNRNNTVENKPTDIKDLVNPEKTSAEEPLSQSTLTLSGTYSGGMINYAITMVAGNDCYMGDNNVTLTAGGAGSPSFSGTAFINTDGWTLTAGMGGLPPITGVNLAAGCYTVNASSNGRWRSNTGRDWCPQDYSTSCSFCLNKTTGAVEQTCSTNVAGVAVDCTKPCTWAPWTVSGDAGSGCRPPVDSVSLLDKDKCADGKCTLMQQETITAQQFLDVCSFAGEDKEDDKCETGDIGCTVGDVIGTIIRWIFNCSIETDYIVAVAPVGLSSDYAMNRDADLEFTRAITMVPGEEGNSDFYEGNVYDEGVVNLNLSIENDGEAEIRLISDSVKPFGVYYQKHTKPHMTSNCAQVQMLTPPAMGIFDTYKEECDSTDESYTYFPGGSNYENLTDSENENIKLTKNISISKKELKNKISDYVKIEPAQAEEKSNPVTTNKYEPVVVNEDINTYRKELLGLTLKYPKEIWNIKNNKSQISEDFINQFKAIVDKYEGEGRFDSILKQFEESK